MSTTIEAVQPEAPPASSPKLSPYLRLVLAVVLAADVLDLMDSTITNIAAPSIVRDIGGGESLIKWLGASYALAMGVLLVVGGRLGDRYGRRRMFLVGMGGFTLASVSCGLAADPALLIASRVIQGGFGAMLIPQGIGILVTTIPRAQQPRAFALFGPVIGGSAVLGPVLAGFIIDANLGGLAWRPIFLINIVLGTLGLVAAARVLPADQPDQGETIDAPGAGLLGAAMFGLIFGLIQGSTSGWGLLPVAGLVAGAGLLVAFGVRQRVAADPLIRPSLLKNRGFTAGLLLGLCFFAAVNGLAYVASLFLQSALGRSPAEASLGLAPMMAGIILAALVSRPAIEVLGRRLVFIGLSVTVVAAAGLWATVTVGGTQMSPWALAPSLLLLGAGMGACFGSIYDIAVGDVAPEEAGSASGSLSAVQQLAGAIGSAVVTEHLLRPAAGRRADPRHGPQRRGGRPDRCGLHRPRAAAAARDQPRARARLSPGRFGAEQTGIAAMRTWRGGHGYKFTGTFSFGSDLDESFWGAGSAFVVTAIVTMFTASKPVSELQGLVWGMVDEPTPASWTPGRGGSRATCWASRLRVSARRSRRRPGASRRARAPPG